MSKGPRPYYPRPLAKAGSWPPVPKAAKKDRPPPKWETDRIKASRARYKHLDQETA